MVMVLRLVVGDSVLGRLFAANNVSVNEESHEQYQVTGVHDKTSQNNLLVDVRIGLVRQRPRLSAYSDTDNHLQDLDNGDDLVEKAISKTRGQGAWVSFGNHASCASSTTYVSEGLPEG
jgi:hypothetical protein